jgi:hypothetical protein
MGFGIVRTTLKIRDQSNSAEPGENVHKGAIFPRMVVPVANDGERLQHYLRIHVLNHGQTLYNTKKRMPGTPCTSNPWTSVNKSSRRA